MNALDLFTDTGLCGSRAEVRRMASQGGLYIQGERVDDPLAHVDPALPEEGVLLLRKGKKKYHRVKFTG